MIVAERRRSIHKLALENGAVKVADLAGALGVGLSTIRADLDVLESEGKLIRSHGGAIIKEPPVVRQPYSETRNQHTEQKSWIGEAALAFLPETGSIFIGGGSTVYQLAVRIPPSSKLGIVTVSPYVAIQCGSHGNTSVDLLGGRIRADSYSTDLSLSLEQVEMLYWDITFIGVSAIDPIRGITSVDRSAASYERKVIEHGSKVIVLCDSSKFGSFSYAMVGPANLVDVIITDSGVTPEDVRELRERGVEVLIAGPQGPDDVPGANGSGQPAGATPVEGSGSDEAEPASPHKGARTDPGTNKRSRGTRIRPSSRTRRAAGSDNGERRPE